MALRRAARPRRTTNSRQRERAVDRRGRERRAAAATAAFTRPPPPAAARGPRGRRPRGRPACSWPPYRLTRSGTPTSAPRRRRRGAVVDDLDLDAVRPVAHEHAGAAGRALLDRARERLLHEPVGGQVDARRAAGARRPRRRARPAGPAAHVRCDERGRGGAGSAAARARSPRRRGAARRAGGGSRSAPRGRWSRPRRTRRAARSRIALGQPPRGGAWTTIPLIACATTSCSSPAIRVRSSSAACSACAARSRCSRAAFSRSARLSRERLRITRPEQDRPGADHERAEQVVDAPCRDTGRPPCRRSAATAIAPAASTSRRPSP